MTYGMEGLGEEELDHIDLEEFGGQDGFGLEGEEFGDPFGLDGFDGRDSFGGGLPATAGGQTAARLIDMYANMAAQADSEEEADAFLPLIAGLAPMALKALAPAARSIGSKVAPKLAQGVMGAGRQMLQRFGQKGMAALPNVVRGVARDSLQRVANGQPLTGEQIMRSAAANTLPYLNDPQRCQQALQRCRQRLRQAQAGAAQAHPQGHRQALPQPGHVPNWCC